MNFDFSSPKKPAEAEVVYDFAPVNNDDSDNGDLWEAYQSLCYSKQPPIPALSVMKPILQGNKFNANLAHYKIGRDLNVIVDMLIYVKTISLLNLSDNALDEGCIPKLVEFMSQSDSISVLNISNNPDIRTKGITDLLDGIIDNRSLESLNISNTGAQNIGSSFAKVISSCQLLARVEAAGCNMRQTAIDVANAIPSSDKLKRLNLSRNMLHVGGRRFASLLGGSVARCSSLKKLFLSENAIDDEMCSALLKGLGDSTALTVLDLSKNQIGEASGRAIANFIGKVGTLRSLDISQNPLLNVTINAMKGQQMLEEGGEKDQNKKDKKPKTYTPGVYIILAALSKNQSLAILQMIGTIAPEEEINAKLESLPSTNPNLTVVFRGPESRKYDPNIKVQLPKVDSSEDDEHESDGE